MASHRREVNWQAPATVCLALIAGAGFAVGHHFFYSSLNGKAAHNNDAFRLLGTSIPTQQFNIAIGTAFAFVANGLLLAAIGAAYIQLFWRAMAYRARKVVLKDLDMTYSALTDLTSLFKLWRWWRYPLLFTLAATSWLLPIASIVPPATLSVVSAPMVPAQSSSENVPNLDFVNLNYVDTMGPKLAQSPANEYNHPIKFFYTGPSRAVYKVVQAVVAEGSISTLTPPGPNTTWSLEFPGPAVYCSNVSDSIQTAIQTNIAAAMQQSFKESQHCKAYGFIAWTPSGIASAPIPAPFTRTGNGSYSLNSLPLNHHTPLPAMIYLAAMPAMMATILDGDHSILPVCINGDGAWNGSIITPLMWVNTTMVQCQLQNATYHATLEYVNGKQNVQVDVVPMDQTALNTITSVMGPSGSSGKYGGQYASPDCNTLNDGQGSPCAFDRTLLSTLSYQAVMEAFNSMLTGSVYLLQDVINPTVESGILDTVLASTPELEFLSRSVVDSSYTNSYSLQQSVLYSNGSLFDGILNSLTTPTNIPLTQAIEQLFQNIVVSLMSSRQLQPNMSSPFAPPLATVTYHTYHNIYSYAKFKLALAYGIAVLCTAIASFIGLYAVLANGASYGPTFSSIFRVSRQAHVGVEIAERDKDGRDPLPSYLADAKVWLNGRVGEGEDSDGASSLGRREAKSVGASSSLLGGTSGEGVYFAVGPDSFARVRTAYY